MTNDLPLILDSMANTLKKMEARIAKLENEATQFRPQQYGTPFSSSGLCRPTEPPSTSIEIDAGTFIGYAIYYSGGYSTTVSPFGWQKQTIEISQYVSSFDNPYYYRYAFLLYNHHLSGTDPWALLEPDEGTTYTDEYETPDLPSYEYILENQAGCNHHFEDPWGGNPLVVPVCVLLLRNNGTTGSPGEIMDITLQDTNFSSFLQLDFRPWYTIPCTYIC